VEEEGRLREQRQKKNNN